MSSRDPAYVSIARAALEVAEERARQLDDIRRALLQGDNARATALMRLYTGIEEEDGEASDPVDPGIH